MNKFAKLQKKQAKESEKRVQKRMEDIIPVAKDIVKLFAAEADSYKFGDIAAGDDESHLDVAQKCLGIMSKHNIKVGDKEFVFQVALQIFSFSKDIAVRSMNMGMHRMYAGSFARTLGAGKTEYDLTFADADFLMKEFDDVEKLSTGKKKKAVDK